MLQFSDIHGHTERFYQRALQDVMISYHFRHLQDFPSHIDHIARFWWMRLGYPPPPGEQHPYRLMAAHFPLKIRPAEIDRWSFFLCKP